MISNILIVVAEAVRNKMDQEYYTNIWTVNKRRKEDYISQELMKKTDVECRVTSLGHVQRGAPPTASDRILAILVSHMIY